MTDDILHTIQNPDELRRLATELLTAQAREYEQRLHNLNTVNATLEQRIHDLHAAMQAEKTAYEQRIRELEEALKLAQQWRFGRKSKRLPASQKPLADEDAASDEADITRQLRGLLPPEEKTGKKPVRQPLPAHLPREETVLAPETGPGDGHPCPGCGAAMRHIRDEVNEVLEYVPAHFVVKRTVRPVWLPGLRHGTQRGAAGRHYRQRAGRPGSADAGGYREGAGPSAPAAPAEDIRP